ncbi:hypothetical protein [Streptomyces sp. NPDC008317]|uniref:hypothetical protein n=1 Tax=Streptomyces sp. NPDC008317 TaxID=3364827 RepID=UPI0036E5BBE7
MGHTRYVRAAFAAADDAVCDALARGWLPGERVAVVHAATRADLSPCSPAATPPTSL